MITATLNMSELTGTDKQIKWASEIRAEFFAEGYRRNLAPIVQSIYQNRANIKGLEEISMDEYKGIVSNAVTLLQTIQDAAFWIDNLDEQEVTPNGDVFKTYYKKVLNSRKMLLAAIALLTTPVQEESVQREITELEMFLASTDFDSDLTKEQFDAQKELLLANAAPDTQFNRNRTVLQNLDYATYAQLR